VLPAEGMAPRIDGSEWVADDEDGFEFGPVVAEIFEVIEEGHGRFGADGQGLIGVDVYGDVASGGSCVEGVGSEFVGISRIDFVVDFSFANRGARGLDDEALEEGGGVGEFESFAGDLFGFV